jgi:hypothetical protein
MAMNPSLVVELAAEWTGKKAFKQADTATQTLTKNVKSLGRAIGITFSAAAVLAYGKASVKAAAADIKAQQQLALALKNVGLERDAATAEGYIQRLQKEFGILDDKLRPAYASLAIATKDIAETQRILGIALDISANTGKDFNAVVDALSKAYLGNNTALSKLGVGISKADLKAKSFQDISEQLAVTFAGSAKKSADSFAGSIDKLAIASNNAKEIIGTSLIGALQSLSKDNTMADLASGIESAAKSLANFVDSIVYLKDQIKSIPGFGLVTYLASGVTDLLGRFSPQHLAELIKQIKGFQGMGNVAMTGGSNMDTQKYDAKQKKILADQVKATQAAAAAKIKADKLAAANALKLKKASALFDLDKISIAAALKGKITEEEKTRLLLMQAIANEDADKAEALAKKLEEIQKKNEEIAKQLTEISKTDNPFAAWATSLGTVTSILSGLPAITDASGNLTSRGKNNIPQDIIDLIDPPADLPTPLAPDTNPFGFSLPSYLADTIPYIPWNTSNEMPATNFAPMPTPSDSYGSGHGFSVPGGVPGGVTVNVTGSVIMQDELVKVVNDAVIAANTNGYNNYRPGAILP